MLRQTGKWILLLYWVGLLGGWLTWEYGGSYVMLPIFLTTPVWAIAQLMLGGVLLLTERKNDIGWIAVGSGVVLVAATADVILILNSF